MEYKETEKLSRRKFRRKVGIKVDTFKKMASILKKEELEEKIKGGKLHSLVMEDRLLMAFEYLREYRTYFHIASTYGLSESKCYRKIRWIEDTLIKHKDFSLPGKKELLKNNSLKVVLTDATGSAIERPKKKQKKCSTQERKNVIP